MTIYRDGVVVATTLTLAAGFAIDERHQAYIPESAKIQPDQPHNHSENRPTTGTTLNLLGASGGMLSNVSARAVTGSSDSPEWVLISSPSAFFHDQYMAERFGHVGINVIVRLSPSENPESDQRDPPR